MEVSKPYFLQNPEWYRYNDDLGRYELTDKATPEAKKSFEDFYDLLESDIVFDGIVK